MNEKIQLLLQLNNINSMLSEKATRSDLEGATLELAQNQSDLEDAVVELAELISEMINNG